MILHFCVIFVLCRTTTGDEIWMPYLAIRKAFNFEAHESSAFIEVSMLLAAAYGVMGSQMYLSTYQLLRNEVVHMKLTAW